MRRFGKPVIAEDDLFVGAELLKNVPFRPADSARNGCDVLRLEIRQHRGAEFIIPGLRLNQADGFR
mgnify:CR=1 FL=1